jgi:hypothetical protein
VLAEPRIDRKWTRDEFARSARRHRLNHVPQCGSDISHYRSFELVYLSFMINVTSMLRDALRLLRPETQCRKLNLTRDNWRERGSPSFFSFLNSHCNRITGTMFEICFLRTKRDYRNVSEYHCARWLGALSTPLALVVVMETPLWDSPSSRV